MGNQLLFLYLISQAGVLLIILLHVQMTSGLLGPTNRGFQKAEGGDLPYPVIKGRFVGGHFTA